LKLPRKTWPRLSIRGKLIVAFGLFGLVPVAAWGGYTVLRAFELLRDGVQHRLETEVVLKAEGIQRLLDDAGRDVRFVSRLPTLRALVELPPERLTADHPLAGRVGEAMLSFSRARPAYYQVRYLDQAGREIVRVDTDGLAPRLVSARDLQDKAGRYYFRDAMRMAPDGVYVSPMDLNVERGLVQVPYTPVVRYAVRVENLRGEARGIVVINLHAAQILRQVLALAHESHEAFLADSRGYYLAGAEGTAGRNQTMPGTTGWLVAHGDRIESAVTTPEGRPLRHVSQDLAPSVVERLLAGKAGAIVEPGLGGRIVAFAPIFPGVSNSRDFWILVRAHRKWEVLATIRSFQVLVVGLGVGVIGLALVAGVVAARHFTRPISELIDGARAIAEGDFERPIRVDTDDELEDLGEQFRRMAARLKAHQQSLSEAHQRAERRAQESQALSRIATEMLGLLALPQILQLVVDKARELLQADLAFLSLHEPEGGLRLAATCGAADALAPRLGAPVTDLPCAERTCQHARCPLLACTPFRSHATVPLRSGERVLGYLCVGFRTGRPVRAEAQEVLAGLGSQAAIAIEKARLHEDVRTLERLEERERIAADLHDGVIQSIYATGLGLEECRRLVDEAPGAVAHGLDEAVERLNLVIRDVRNYVVGLQPERLQERGLSHALRELACELALNALLDTAVDIDPDVDRWLRPEQTGHLFHIAREALTNVVKHAGGAKATLALRRVDSRVSLCVEDDGVGFDPARCRASGRGLRNMAERAKRLGGTLTVEGEFGRGTRITIDVAAEGRP